MIAIDDPRAIPVVGIEFDIGDPINSRWQRGYGGQGTAGRCANVNSPSLCDVQHIGVIHTTAASSVRDRARNDTDANLADRVALIGGFIDGVTAADDQSRRSDFIESNRSHELRRKRRPATGHGQPRINRRAHLIVRSIPHRSRERSEIEKTGVTNRLARSRQRRVVHGDVATVSYRETVPDQTAWSQLIRRPRVLVTTEKHIGVAVIGDVVLLGDLQVIANHRIPVAGVIARIGPAIDATVIDFNQVAVLVKDDAPRIRVRRAAVGGAAAGNGRNIIADRQVLPLR